VVIVVYYLNERNLNQGGSLYFETCDS